MAGYRFGKFLPYYYHGNITQKSPRSVAGMVQAKAAYDRIKSLGCGN